MNRRCTIYSCVQKFASPTTNMWQKQLVMKPVRILQLQNKPVKQTEDWFEKNGERVVEKFGPPQL